MTTMTSCWNELCVMFVVNVCHARLPVSSSALSVWSLFFDVTARPLSAKFLPSCILVIGGFDKWLGASHRSMLNC